MKKERNEGNFNFSMPQNLKQLLIESKMDIFSNIGKVVIFGIICYFITILISVISRNKNKNKKNKKSILRSTSEDDTDNSIPNSPKINWRRDKVKYQPQTTSDVHQSRLLMMEILYQANRSDFLQVVSRSSLEELRFRADRLCAMIDFLERKNRNVVLQLCSQNMIQVTRNKLHLQQLAVQNWLNLRIPHNLVDIKTHSE